MIDIAKYIESFESFEPNCYEDGAGKSIGYGFACRGRSNMTREEADLIIRAEVRRIDTIIPTGLYTAQEKKAIISLMYNAPKLQVNKYFLRDLREKDKEQLAAYFNNRTKAYNPNTDTWQVMGGLKKRRYSELVLFFNN